MRMKSVLLGDMRFQLKYGFYFIYLVLSALYIGVLFALPVEWRKTAGILMIFTDPAAMGLFFMGAIVLFEKSERVLNSIAISPVTPLEYVLSKLLSIGIISTVVAAAIGICSSATADPIAFVLGVFLCSCLFSAVGLIVAAKISTLNAFMIATVPAELVINLPALAYLFGWQKSWLLFHPGVCMIELCGGGQNKLLAVLVLLVWTVLLVAIAYFTVKKMFKEVGGVKL